MDLLEDSKNIVDLFFHDLKAYNSTNFAAIRKADLCQDELTVNKAFSSIVTRYFIFADKHPELSDSQKRALYFMLKIDLIAKYFSEYPDNRNVDILREFQLQLIDYSNKLVASA